MKYHEYINIGHYKLAREKNLSSRDEAYGGPTFDQRYKENEIQELFGGISINPTSTILVIGTGTGADACWLADQGHKVTGIDIVQDAIDMAKELAQERSTRVDYYQDDICNIKNTYGAFDIIIDSFCLQSIVSEYERTQVFSFIKNHMRENGRYIIISAGYSTRNAYHDHYDLVLVDGVAYLPVRRHHTLDMLVNELLSHGFKIQYSNTEQDWGALKVITTI